MNKILLSSFLALGLGVSAQVTGTKTIGMDYLTLADAFTDLNTNGVGSGGATINIPAGYTETSPVGGYQLGSTVLNASLSAINTLLIQKNGAGPNPVFTGYAGTSSTVDAIFKFSGVDYTTIDGLNLQDNSANTTPTTFMERGFAFYNLTATDGCNYNTVKNTNITFSTSINYPSAGIYFAHSSNTGTAISPTSIDGTHSNNKIYGNTINHAFLYGIVFLGFNATAPYTLYDQNNDIGGNSSATGNTISDQGSFAGDSNSYVTSNGIVAQYQNNANVSNNSITFGQGIGSIGLLLLGTNSTFTANNNNITATDRSTYYASSTNLSSHYGIYLGSTGAILTANNNNINISATQILSGTSIPAVYGIINAGTGAGNFTATNNTVKGNSIGSYYGLYSTSTANSNISSNNIGNITTSSSLSTSTAYGVYLAATGTTTDVKQNKIYNLVSNGSAGVVHGIYVAGATVSSKTNIVNNLIGDLKTPVSNSTSPSISGIYLASTGATSNLNLYYNSIYLNATSTGANFNTTGVYHTFNTTASTAALDLRNNIIVNLSTPNGTGTASALRRSAATNLNNYALTSNNNNFAVGTATNSAVYYNGTTRYNHTDFLTNVATRETSSLNITPIFVSTTGIDANFLKLNVNATTTQTLDNKGSTIAGYTTDYSGVTRDTTPDMGAYEFTYVAPTVAPDCTTVSNPANAATSVTPNPATLSWASANNATSYKLYVGTTSGGTDILNGTVTTNLSYPITLEPNRTYYVKIVASNDIGDAGNCTETSFTTGNLVYCTFTYNTIEPISNVNFAGINNSSSPTLGTTGGYQDFTNITGEVRQNTSYTIELQGNTDTTTTSSYTSYFSVFIDWNQNGTLNDAGEVYFGDGSVFVSNSNGADGKIASGNISVPAGAKLGKTRMRIKKEFSAALPSSAGNFANPCAVGQPFGQVEDYTVEVKEFLAAIDTNKGNNLFVYPNPFTDVLKISDVKGVKSISVNDMSGRQVKTLSPTVEVNLSSLQGGLYIVNLQMEDGSVKSFKTIKK